MKIPLATGANFPTSHRWLLRFAQPARLLERTMTLLIDEPQVANDLQALSSLVDAYRVFYGQLSDLPAARAFVRDRLEHADSRFFVARTADGKPIAFAHLLSSLDTLSLRPIGILEDIYVAESQRRAGIGAALLEAAEAYARTRGYARLTLATAHQNRTAQRLYLAHEYIPDQRFRSFNRFLEDSPARTL